MTYAVAVKNTLDTGDWTPDVKAIEKLKQLKIREPESVIIVHDPSANTDNGVRLLLKWLYANDVPFDDIWQGFGKPEADVYYDNRSKKL